MHISLDDVLNMSSREIAGWREYFNAHLFTHEREDIRHAELMVSIHNMSGRSLKDSNLKKLEDFLPDYLQPNKQAVKQSQLKPDDEKIKWMKLIDARKRAGLDKRKKGG